MLPEIGRQDFVPLPTGSNPLWLEKKEKKKNLVRYLSALAIMLLAIATVVVVQDYNGVRDPNASECRLGFAETGCPAGYKCVGNIVECKETGEKYKYRLTSMIFPEKKCSAAREYREYCIAG